ncbi:SCP2 sterol-binding domain-containing protein [Pelagibaculum spongiae]|uniref:SCP2 domain-containing protein n=1 Tax=Pelagibaculum spongiae TaxID=2080658 RepID=A0A2V1H1L4_9GAMM|nr:SCP2 sterol-binding domain-containing protein [Pelagibaculum spongiae]PVZ69570.1 hypothetical protein DC094_09640 [Pelagibaculum spongiae]
MTNQAASSEINADELVKAYPKLFRPDVAEKENLSGDFQIRLTDSEQCWFTRIEDNQCTIHDGDAAEPTFTLITDTSNLILLVKGELNEAMAVMLGKVKLEGNISAALKYIRCFDKLKN